MDKKAEELIERNDKILKIAWDMHEKYGVRQHPFTKAELLVAGFLVDSGNTLDDISFVGSIGEPKIAYTDKDGKEMVITYQNIDDIEYNIEGPNNIFKVEEKAKTPRM